MIYKWVEIHAKSFSNTTVRKIWLQITNKPVRGVSLVYLILEVSICLKQTFKKLNCNDFEMQFQNEEAFLKFWLFGSII